MFHINPSTSLRLTDAVPETLFISDLHLDAKRPQIIDLLRAFLDERARYADALYILGDLFEYWIGDDDERPEFRPVFAALKTLGDTGVPVYFMSGNRDFLVGQRFTELSSCKILSEPARIILYDTPTLLLHGDILCTDDELYQALRRHLHDSSWQAHFLSLPVADRRKQALVLRSESQASVRQKPLEIMDVNRQAVNMLFTQTGTLRMIHGHTHRPGIHRYPLNDRAVERIVLGDWYAQGSVLSINPQGFQLEEIIP